MMRLWLKLSHGKPKYNVRGSWDQMTGNNDCGLAASTSDLSLHLRHRCLLTVAGQLSLYWVIQDEFLGIPS